MTTTTTTTPIAAIIANIARQARYPERAVLITGEAARELLEYIAELEAQVAEMEQNDEV